jgi:hypothetical protein
MAPALGCRKSLFDGAARIDHSTQVVLAVLVLVLVSWCDVVVGLSAAALLTSGSDVGGERTLGAHSHRHANTKFKAASKCIACRCVVLTAYVFRVEKRLFAMDIRY